MNPEINNNFMGTMIPFSFSPFKAVDKAYYKSKPNHTEFDNYNVNIFMERLNKHMELLLKEFDNN